MDKIGDKQAKVQSTLLEYGQKNFLLTSLASQQQQNQQQTKGLKQAQEEQLKKQVLDTDAEEANLKRLMNEMSAADQKQNKLSANAVGQILGLQQEALKQIVNEFTSKVKDNKREREGEWESEMLIII